MITPEDCIKYLLTLKSNGVYTMQKIEFWLLQYSDFYKETCSLVSSNDIFELDNGQDVRLPSFWNSTDNDKFLDLYKALDIISDFHRAENHMRDTLVEYHTVKNCQSDLKQWIRKNEYLIADKYASFYFDYLDYDEDDNELNLLVYVESVKEFQIYIDKNEFKYTLEFLNLFQDSSSAEQSLEN
ncbi:hypothetical protein D9O36_14550 [Zobellia amurskyensis]|uniref:Uncharacterized protein n=2 Tax=Zobellia amurskyensis TaxID=248905 RepID=A0A7X3D2B5_9FLAO|nr:hypothetical protein [Zobellia amurskyensis]